MYSQDWFVQFTVILLIHVPSQLLQILLKLNLFCWCSFSRQQLWNFGGISLELPFKYDIDATSQDWKSKPLSTAHLVMNCDAWATDTPFPIAHCD